jgi:hypothetical protein
MFNAEDIIELEKKWLKYKIRQKIKYFALFFIILTISIASFYTYKTFYNQPQKKVEIKKIVKKVEKKEIPKVKKETLYKAIPTNKFTAITPKTLHVATKEKEKTITKTAEKKETIEVKKEEPYTFHLEPTEQLNELFSSSGKLTFNTPYNIKKPPKKVVKKTINLQELDNYEESSKKTSTIKIDMEDMDTIAYLKEKFYTTSSIVFALMIAEEYYNQENYKNSLKWSLIANDIDAQNEKSWYWFAKSKAKLNQKSDAIKALKAYLSQNSSKRLSALLNKIQHGETDDL